MALPGYAWIGLGVLAGSEAGMLLRIEPFWTWHTPIAWTGYILALDGFVFARTGASWLTRHRGEFLFLALVSIPLWVIFEGYNLLIRNWYYIHLPEHPAVRLAGYAWAFATISPGIFLTADAIAVVRGRPTTPPPARWRDPALVPLVAAGAVMLLLPIVWPSPYLAAPVFLGFVFLLDPINARAGDESLLAEARHGRYDRAVNLLLAGVVCGGLWEFWNYWARAKWVYTVPIFGDLKIFEMPVLGYFGFPPFALECFAMYVFVRRWIWRAPGKAVGV